MVSRSSLSVLAVGLLLAACSTMPKGPSMLVLPGTAKNFDQFRADDVVCRDYATYQVGGRDAQAAADDSIARSAALGTALGAVAGAAIDGSRGAAVGAGTGMLFGGLAGTGAGQGSGYSVQSRYDNAYVQCMYAKGDRVPVSGALVQPHSQPPAASQLPPTAPAGSYPPPPPGSPPPPPPR